MSIDRARPALRLVTSQEGLEDRIRAEEALLRRLLSTTFDIQVGIARPALWKRPWTRLANARMLRRYDRDTARRAQARAQQARSGV